MLRVLHHILFGLSLMALVALSAGAVRSCFAYDRLESDRQTDLGGPWRRDWVRIDSNAGRLDINVLKETRTNRAQFDDLRARAKPLRIYERGGRHTMPTINPWLLKLNLYGEMIVREDRFFVRVIFPYWLPMALLLIWPVTKVLQRLRGRRVPAGHCVKCGYDLRASRERCPECGTAIEESRAQAVVTPATG